MIFWNKRWAWWFTAVMFLLNNTVSRTVTQDVQGIVLASDKDSLK